ncbi:MAG: class I SAM-dependent methyltransferase [Natronospirillum sp.]|uniref:class I SAM-dependent methyltransferase n=1 Tax=Natronospirillum sp. TaxID=2812955 RepID=UPI0025DF0A3F|nr:class I SAM-dependent methyltransferase [Natronospirillum sp.]MCH8553333.1 class I SAM-dependent methyltransferase [Natronospirillum sp.]
MPAPDACTLCGSRALSLYHEDHRRPYWVCEDCSLVQVPAACWLSATAEKAEYDKHENRVDDPGYRRFLARSFNPVSAAIRPPARGLDFGCGPGPALAAMFTEAGYDMALFDHFYFPDESVLSADYDFITATEVLEHLHDPAAWLNRLWKCLKSGGLLVVQTKRVVSQEHFAEWHYTRDPTHVIFFSIATLQWLAGQWGAKVRLTDPDVAVFHKQD